MKILRDFICQIRQLQSTNHRRTDRSCPVDMNQLLHKTSSFFSCWFLLREKTNCNLFIIYLAADARACVCVCPKSTNPRTNRITAMRMCEYVVGQKPSEYCVRCTVRMRADSQMNNNFD